MNALLLAAVSEPAPPGRTSSLGVAIILLCLAAGVALSVFLAARGRSAARTESGRNPPAEPEEDGAAR